MNTAVAKGVVKIQSDNAQSMPTVAHDAIILITTETHSAWAQIRRFTKKCNLKGLSALPHSLRHNSQQSSCRKNLSVYQRMNKENMVYIHNGM